MSKRNSFSSVPYVGWLLTLLYDFGFMHPSLLVGTVLGLFIPVVLIYSQPKEVISSIQGLTGSDSKDDTGSDENLNSQIQLEQEITNYINGLRLENQEIDHRHLFNQIYKLVTLLDFEEIGDEFSDEFTDSQLHPTFVLEKLKGFQHDAVLHKDETDLGEAKIKTKRVLNNREHYHSLDPKLFSQGYSRLNLEPTHPQIIRMRQFVQDGYWSALFKVGFVEDDVYDEFGVGICENSSYIRGEEIEVKYGDSFPSNLRVEKYSPEYLCKELACENKQIEDNHFIQIRRSDAKSILHPAFGETSDIENKKLPECFTAIVQPFTRGQ